MSFVKFIKYVRKSGETHYKIDKVLISDFIGKIWVFWNL